MKRDNKIKKLFNRISTSDDLSMIFLRGLLIIIALPIIISLVSIVFLLLVHFIVYIWWFIKWPLGVLVCLFIILFTGIVLKNKPELKNLKKG